MPTQSGPRHSFTIRTAEDFFGKLEDERADFQRQPADSRHAINCAMTAWHLTDWIWADWLKGSPDTQQKLFGSLFKNIKDFKKHVVSGGECPDLEVMQSIATGSKHFGAERKEVDSTGRKGTAFSPRAFQQDAFQVGTLVVRLPNGQERLFKDILGEVTNYWRNVVARR